MSRNSLVLFPVQSDVHLPGTALLSQHLQAIGLAGERFRNNDFLAGENLLDMIAFMGCSPHFRLEPETGEDFFTFVRLHSDADRMICMFSRGMRPPRCPACQSGISDWEQHAGSDRDCVEPVPCQSCGSRVKPWELDWRRQAGFGRRLVEITDIYPKEAIPQSSLLDELGRFSGTPWNYFYMQY